MKRIHALVIALVIAVVATSCTYFRPNQVKVQQDLQERGRELTSGAKVANDEAKKHIDQTKALLKTADVPTNSASPVTIKQPTFKEATNELQKADNALTVGGELLRRDENIMGKPLVDQTPIIMQLLSDNKAVREIAAARERSREAEETRWRAKVEELERKLVEYGTKYEQERNEKITSWIKWSSIALLAIGLPIALTVLFPPFASFLVGIFPALGHIFNAPISMTKNLVRGVGNAREELRQQARFDYQNVERLDNYQPKTYTAEEVLKILDNHLKENLDATDKKIIAHYRQTQNVA